MNLDLENNLIKNNKSESQINSLMSNLKEYIEKNLLQLDKKLHQNNFDENKLITKYRDKMNLEKINLINSYADKTKEKGQMYYIYGKNSEQINTFNLSICNEENSHTVIEENISNLPKNVEVGSVLRKEEEKYILDNTATQELTAEISELQEKIMQEQQDFLQSKRIENHTYEVSEKSEDRIWLFDITSNETEALEEINIQPELLKDFKEGDILIYKDGKYEKGK